MMPSLPACDLWQISQALCVVAKGCMKMSLSWLAAGHGFGARQGGDPQHPKSAQKSQWGTGLFAQASLLTGSQWLLQGCLSWSLRSVQSQVLAVHSNTSSDPARLQTPAPSYLLHHYSLPQRRCQPQGQCYPGCPTHTWMMASAWGVVRSQLGIFHGAGA